MREETALYRALYQSILTQIYSGVIRRGQRFPSQRQICAQYNVGITTVRKAIRMLEEEGVIDAGPGRRATVRFDAHSEACARALARRADAIRSAYIALQIVAVSGGRLALAAAQGLPAAACGAIAAQWEGMWGEALPHQAVQLLLGFLKSQAPGACLKEILGQLDALLIWGYYLKRLPRDPRAPALEEELGRHFREAAALLRRGEAGAFAGQAQAVLRCAYRFARRQLAALVPDPARLPAALEGPQSPRATGAGRMGNK